MSLIGLQCNVRRLIEYPSIWGFVRDLYQTPGVGETINKEHITKHYMVRQQCDC